MLTGSKIAFPQKWRVISLLSILFYTLIVVKNLAAPSTEISNRHKIPYCLLTISFFSDSEKFHEMAAATESPPKQCFLLDDDGEFPPMNNKAWRFGNFRKCALDTTWPGFSLIFAICSWCCTMNTSRIKSIIGKYSLDIIRLYLGLQTCNKAQIQSTQRFLITSHHQCNATVNIFVLI